MNNKWWNEPSIWERLKEMFLHPEAVSDAFIVALTLICIGIVSLSLFCL